MHAGLIKAILLRSALHPSPSTLAASILRTEILRTPTASVSPLLSLLARGSPKPMSTFAPSRRSLHPYQPPDWARALRHIPTTRLHLAQSPTPIHPWTLPGLPSDVVLYIKRDDLTGAALSGNKVRKLEFLLADALSRRASSVVTCGAVQSNHARATAVAARQLGLGCYLYLRSKTHADPHSLGFHGNVLLDRLSGATIVPVPPQPYETGLKPLMEELVARAAPQESIYLIPVGGSNVVGVWGYIDGFREMLEQGIAQSVDDIVVACGSGGTIAGLAIANHLAGSPCRIHAVTVCDNAAEFHSHINGVLAELGLGATVVSESIVDIVDGYKGAGYGLSRPEELEFMYKVSAETGIFLDPVYSGKAAFGLVKELQRGEQSARFKGNRVLFIHTGGLFGIDHRMNEYMETQQPLSHEAVLQRFHPPQSS